MKYPDITYTFCLDFPVAELRGITLTGGKFCRIDGLPGNPDAVRFARGINGKSVMARIVGKSELESALADYLAAHAKKEAILSAIGWTDYAKARNAAINAFAAYERASEHGYPAKEAAAMRIADAKLATAKDAFPDAALYAMADGFSMSANYVKAAAGRDAMDAIESGCNPSEAIAAMKAAWADYCTHAATYD